MRSARLGRSFELALDGIQLFVEFVERRLLGSERIGKLAFTRPQLLIRTAAGDHFQSRAQVFQLRANLLTLLLYAAIGTFFFVFPLNLIQIQGYSATATGAAALPTILLMFSLSRW